jgi:hypothetical protein
VASSTVSSVPCHIPSATNLASSVGRVLVKLLRPSPNTFRSVIQAISEGIDPSNKLCVTWKRSATRPSRVSYFGSSSFWLSSFTLLVACETYAIEKVLQLGEELSRRDCFLEG